MRVAMIGQKGIPATYGGVERHVEELSARLAGRGHDVTVFCRRHYTERRHTHRGVQLRLLPSINTKHLDAITHTALSAAASVLSRFDLVHFHAIGPCLLSFLPRFLRPRCAVVATVHSLDWRRRKWGPFAKCVLRLGERAAVRFPHRTIVVSRQLLNYFLDRGRQVVHIPNGVTAPQREPMRKLKDLGLSEGNFILWIGRFVPEKRVADLISAFRRLPTDLRLLLAGELDENDPHLRALRAAAGDDRRIVFAGGLYGRAKAEALTNARLAVFPSDLEGFPIALLECMRYGLPVLASDIPEHLEAVKPDENAFAFSAGNSASLETRIAWLLDHPEQAQAAGKRAETDASAYDWDVITSKTESIYRQATAECA